MPILPKSIKTVKSGQTWTSLAKQLGITEQSLANANPGVTQLAPGQVITVPKPSTAPPTIQAGGGQSVGIAAPYRPMPVGNPPTTRPPITGYTGYTVPSAPAPQISPDVLYAQALDVGNALAAGVTGKGTMPGFVSFGIANTLGMTAQDMASFGYTQGAQGYVLGTTGVPGTTSVPGAVVPQYGNQYSEPAYWSYMQAQNMGIDPGSEQAQWLSGSFDKNMMKRMNPKKWQARMDYFNQMKAQGYIFHTGSHGTRLIGMPTPTPPPSGYGGNEVTGGTPYYGSWGGLVSWRY